MIMRLRPPLFNRQQPLNGVNSYVRSLCERLVCQLCVSCITALWCAVKRCGVLSTDALQCFMDAL